MSLKRYVLVANGDMFVKEWFYSCNGCGVELFEAYPHYIPDNTVNVHYCGECAFKLGLISERKYIHDFYFFDIRIKRAGINPITGDVEVTDRKFSWEKTDKDYRHSTQYVLWRVAVFERDHYTCLDCGQVGGNLEAHHIKPFNTFPDLRYVADNGITLCQKCHKQKHKKAANK